MFLAIPFVSGYSIDANETFTINLTKVLNISLNQSNCTSITVNITHPTCNTSANCTCEECNYLSYQEEIDQLNTSLLIAQNNITFYKEQISNLTSENEKFINDLLINKSYECPACPSIPSCPACPSCTIPSLPACQSCPACNLTCPQPITPIVEEPAKPSKAPWIISGILFLMLVSLIFIVRKNGEPEKENVSKEFSEEFEG